MKEDNLLSLPPSSTHPPAPSLIPSRISVAQSTSPSPGHVLFGEMVNKDKSFKHWNLFFIHSA